MKLETTIFVEPTPKARPRTTIRKGRVVTYTPRGTAHAENLIRDKAMELGIFFDAGVPLRVEATFYRPKPKSTPKRVALPVARPDWDNYGKLLTDALEKFVYPSDSAITTCTIRKRFGSPPRIELSIEPDYPSPTG